VNFPADEPRKERKREDLSWLVSPREIYTYKEKERKVWVWLVRAVHSTWEKGKNQLDWLDTCITFLLESTKREAYADLIHVFRTYFIQIGLCSIYVATSSIFSYGY
jgi:hypothetical protein